MATWSRGEMVADGMSRLTRVSFTKPICRTVDARDACASFRGRSKSRGCGAGPGHDTGQWSGVLFKLCGHENALLS
jgi:hypothetical protein